MGNLNFENKATFVVEGKTDIIKLEKLAKNMKFIVTNGTDIIKNGENSRLMSEIKRTARNHNLVLFLDPDGPGRRIRSMIKGVLNQEHLEYYDAHVAICHKGGKVGVAEARNDLILKTLNDILNKINN